MNKSDNLQDFFLQQLAELRIAKKFYKKEDHG